jgi:hypothetical protein
MRRTNRRASRLLPLALVAALGGCSSTVTQHWSYRSGVNNTFTYAASGGEMEVVVVGNPFNVPKADVDRFVTDSMQGHNYGPPTHFTTTPQRSRPGYRVVVVLGPPVSFSGDEACSGTFPTVPSRPADVLNALMVFCSKDTVMSESSGRVVASPRPDVGAFGPLMAAMTRDLIPFQDRDSDDHNLLLMDRGGANPNG